MNGAGISYLFTNGLPHFTIRFSDAVRSINHLWEFVEPPELDYGPNEHINAASRSAG